MDPKDVNNKTTTVKLTDAEVALNHALTHIATAIERVADAIDKLAEVNSKERTWRMRGPINP